MYTETVPFLLKEIELAQHEALAPSGLVWFAPPNKRLLDLDRQQGTQFEVFHGFPFVFVLHSYCMLFDLYFWSFKWDSLSIVPPRNQTIHLDHSDANVGNQQYL